MNGEEMFAMYLLRFGNKRVKDLPKVDRTQYMILIAECKTGRDWREFIELYADYFRRIDPVEGSKGYPHNYMDMQQQLLKQGD